MAALSSSAFETVFSGLSPTGLTAEQMAGRVQSSGGALTVDDLNGAIDAYRLKNGAISLQNWRLLLALQVGDAGLKAREAFRLLDQDGDGWIQLADLKRLIHLFEVSEQTADAIAIEIARDGSDRIDLQRLLDYLPEGFEAHPRAYPGGIGRWIPMRSPAVLLRQGKAIRVV